MAVAEVFSAIGSCDSAELETKPPGLYRVVDYNRTISAKMAGEIIARVDNSEEPVTVPVLCWRFRADGKRVVLVPQMAGRPYSEPYDQKDVRKCQELLEMEK